MTANLTKNDDSTFVAVAAVAVASVEEQMKELGSGGGSSSGSRIHLHVHVLPKCTLPSPEELRPVQAFVSNAIASNNDSTNNKQQLQGYRAIMDCLRKKEDPILLRKVLLALRTAGSTLHTLTKYSERHAHLLHLLFRLDPFESPRSIATNNHKNNKPNDDNDRTGPFFDYSLADSHLHLLLALVSANSVFLTPALHALWRLLYETPEATTHPHPSCDNTNTQILTRAARLHAALATLLRLCPKGNIEIVSILASEFPFRTKPTFVLEWYTVQCLEVQKYVPTVHAKVLELIIDKCLEMDVEIKINNGGNVSIDVEDDTNDDGNDDDNTMFDLDLDESRSSSSHAKASHTDGSSNQTTTKEQDISAQVDEMADKLDSIMLILLQHIKERPESARQLYRMVSPVFESSILTTHRSKFVQFVLLVICGMGKDDAAAGSSSSMADGNVNNDVVAAAAIAVTGREEEQGLESQLLDRDFCSKLIDIVLDPYRATVTRQISACYLASFVSRASYVCPETVGECISALLRWAEAYMESLTKNKIRAADARNQCDLHSLFYTVCQAAFYTMCFRGTDAIQYYRAATEYHKKKQARQTNTISSTSTSTDTKNSSGDGGRDTTSGGDEHPQDEEDAYATAEYVDIGSERWSKICSHELQPLKYCLESVRGEFLHVAHVFDLLDSNLWNRLVSEDRKMATISLPKNKTKKGRPRASLIITAVTLEKKRIKGGVGGLGQGSNPLDSFFPFDPYLLRRSHGLVEPFYKNWGGSVEKEDLVVQQQQQQQQHVEEGMDEEFQHDGDGDGDDDDDSHDNESTSDNSSDSSSDDDDNDDDNDSQQLHMPESVDSTAYLQNMNGTPRASFMDTGLSSRDKQLRRLSGFSPDPESVRIQKERQQEVWTNVLKRARAPSIENGSW